jgi:hypothetical protein
VEDSLATRFADIVQVRCDQPNSFGSGRVIAEDLVLTARHVVGKTDGPLHPGPFTVFRWTDLREGKVEPVSAAVAWEAPADNRGHRADVVVLRLQGAAPVKPVLQLRFGQAPANPTDAWVAGFPWLLALPERGTAAPSGMVNAVLPGGIDECNLPGTCYAAQLAEPVLAFKAARAVGSPREPAHDTASRWCGLSGGVVVIGEFMVGVMRRQDGRFAPDTELDAVPLAFLATDPALQNLLPATCVPHWPIAVPRQSMTQPPPEVQHLSEVLQTLDRVPELGRVAGSLKHMSSGSVLEVVVHAQTADLPDRFFRAACEGPLATLVGLELPPWECEWPASAASANTIESLIAQQLGQLLGDYFATTFSELAETLKTADPAPWVHLKLAPTIDAAGADVIERWRKCWVAVAEARGDRCGYFLSFDGSASSWQAIRAVLQREIPGVVQDAPVVLQPVKLEDLLIWPNKLAALAKRSPAYKNYSALASLLVPHIQSRGWVRFQPYDLQRVMVGDKAI